MSCFSVGPFSGCPLELGAANWELVLLATGNWILATVPHWQRLIFTGEIGVEGDLECNSQEFSVVLT